MDRSKLERYLADRMSLPQIGALAGRDASTVGYWVQKHGLSANGRGKFAPRGGLTLEQLEPLARRGATLREMAHDLDRSIATVRHWLQRHELSTSGRRGPRGRRAEALAARAAGLTRFISQCTRHGETEFLAFPRGTSRCARCNAEAVARRRRRVKRILIGEAGGKCNLCEYNRSQQALQFHHRDPQAKAFGVSHGGVSRSLKRSRAEAQKCVLLCANCHAEVEAGDASMEPAPLAA